MSTFEQQIEQFSKRPPAFSAGEIETRRTQMRDYRFSCKLEGINPPKINQKLYDLMVEGRITTQEYIEFCKKLYS